VANFFSWIIVGQIIKSIGLKGQVKVKSFCENPSSIIDYNPILIEDFNEPIILSKQQIKNNNYLIAKIPFINDKEEANRLIGKKLYANREKFPTLLDDEFYFSDLEDCLVYDVNEKIFGKVLGIFNFGAGDLLEISKSIDNTSLFILFNTENFPFINLKSKKLIVKYPIL